MRVNRRLSSALVMSFVLLLSKNASVVAESNSLMENSSAVFTTIAFVSNIETIGVAVSGTGLPLTAELSYRKSGESLWHSGHPLMRIDDGRLIGSLFSLLPATAYDIKVRDGSAEINGSVSTQPEQLSFTPSVILNVNDDAPPGGDGSAAAPFRTIQEAVNHAGPGTQVLVADGIYREAVTFPNSGTEGNWIQVKAASNAAILDSADRLSGNIWTAYSTSHVWFKQISGPIAYVARDGKRYYQYDDRTGLMQARGHGGVTMNEGWFYEPSTLRLYVRSRDEPANHTWQIPRLNHAFDLAARDWIWIEGFEVRFYGTTTNGCGVCTLNSSHIVIRSNKIHNMQLGIFIQWNGTADQGNDTRIEGNEVYDPLVDEWPWAAVKGSFMEGTGIIIRGRTGGIVRDNHVHNFFNGIYTGSSGALENPELAFDADIYNNYIHHVSDDALEPEGACINHRFRHNAVDRSFIGLSIAPITQGPTWVLRNTFTNFTGRGIKFANNSDGNVRIYHNTGWTSANNINGMDLITSIHNVVMRNNTFQSTGYSFAEVPTGSTANDWNHNNWYTTRGSTGPHFKWENINYNTISALCTASGLECDGYENLPGFTNPTGGDFTLLSSSPNIDRGVVIPGINDDFVGNAPDVGAYESAFDLPPTVLSSVRANSNPTHAIDVGFTVTFSKLVTGVNNSDFVLTTAGVTGASITDVMGSGANYTVSVNTGSGNGTIRLDVVDDDSIRDVSDHPLGGTGTGNGNFVEGESYNILKTSMIAGNAGEADTTLSYMDNGLQAVVADSSGNYSITVPYGWSGTVTPSLGGDTFCPGSKTYTHVTANLTSQNYAHSMCPQFDPMSQWTTDYSYNAQQWRVPYHSRLTGDVDGDGDDDIVGFGYDRVLVALSNGTNGFAPMTQWTTDYSYNAQQWRVEFHPRLLGDVNGDGKADIVGFGFDRVLVALSDGTQFLPMQQWTTDFSYNAQGWRVPFHPRLVGDVNGDGKADLVGFGNDRVLVALSTGSSFAPMTQWTTDYSYNAQGWRVEYHPRMLGDVNGDGRDDIVGFGYDRVLVALSNGSGFASMVQATTDYSYNAQQWRVQYHPRLLGDVNNDGKADIVGFGFDHVLVAISK